MNPLEYLLVFIKASLFSTGGFGNLPSLHQDLLANGWATETEFAQSLAIGQISPGPNGLWVISLGYFSYGFLGALLALVAICLPPLLVLGLQAIYSRIEHLTWVQGLMRGISLAVVGLTLTVSWTIINGPNLDWKSPLIGLAAFGLGLSGKVNVLVILGLAAVCGLIFF